MVYNDNADVLCAAAAVCCTKLHMQQQQQQQQQQNQQLCCSVLLISSLLYISQMTFYSHVTAFCGDGRYLETSSETFFSTLEDGASEQRDHP
jgi:hypothetical protein